MARGCKFIAFRNVPAQSLGDIKRALKWAVFVFLPISISLHVSALLQSLSVYVSLVSELSGNKAKSLRFKLGINASGTFVPNPVCSFAHFGFDEQLMSVIRRSDYTQPTPIQSQAIPAALSGRDVIGIAKTGSGKTAAYLWPMIVHIMDQPTLKKGDGPIGMSSSLRFLNEDLKCSYSLLSKMEEKERNTIFNTTRNIYYKKPSIEKSGKF